MTTSNEEKTKKAKELINKLFEALEDDLLLAQAIVVENKVDEMLATTSPQKIKDDEK